MALDIIARGIAAHAQSYAAAAEEAKEAAQAAAEAAAESARTLTIDDTLTEQGEAADAKATGDAIHATQSMIAGRESSSTATRNYAVGDMLIVSGVLYRATAAIASGETITAGVNVTADAVSEEIAGIKTDKADKNGVYEDLTAGNAEQIVSDMRITDRAPYVFRTAGGGAEIGDRAYIDKIVGGTLVWNQLAGLAAADYTLTAASISAVGNAITLTAADSGTVRLAKIKATKKDHVYFGRVGGISISGANVTTARFSLFSSGNSVITNLAYYSDGATNQTEGICKCTDESQFIALRISPNGIDSSNSATFDGVQLFDLTQMFGAAVADHVLALETATPGAGVAWFRALFPAAYYAYDTGTLRSVNASAHRTVGFNAFDLSAGTARLLGGAAYQITGTYTALAYSTGETITPDADGKFTPGANGTLTVTGGDGTTCVHLVWDGERDGQYEAYSAHTYALDDALTLRGVPGLDADNNLVYDGDEYAPDGTVTRKYGDADIGALTWETTSYEGVFRCAVRNFPGIVRPAKDVVPSAVCSAYPVGAIPQTADDMGDGTIGIGRGGVNYVYIKDTGVSTAEALTQKISGAHFTYALASEETGAADPYTSPQIVDNWGTEEYADAGVAAGTRDVAIPVGHVTGYPPDLRAKIEAAPDSPDADGDYIMRRTGGVNAYAPLTRELPAAPTTDGTYRLVCTVSGGTATLSWVSES